MGVVTIAGAVYAWGDGDYGKLGRGGSDGSKTPKLVEKLQGLDVVRVFCGAQFSVALTKSGALYTWWVQARISRGSICLEILC